MNYTTSIIAEVRILKKDVIWTNDGHNQMVKMKGQKRYTILNKANGAVFVIEMPTLKVLKKGHEFLARLYIDKRTKAVTKIHFLIAEGRA